MSGLCTICLVNLLDISKKSKTSCMFVKIKNASSIAFKCILLFLFPAFGACILINQLLRALRADICVRTQEPYILIQFVSEVRRTSSGPKHLYAGMCVCECVCCAGFEHLFLCMVMFSNLHKPGRSKLVL
jgi:hypothetical protein